MKQRRQNWTLCEVSEEKWKGKGMICVTINPAASPLFYNSTLIQSARLSGVSLV